MLSAPAFADEPLARVPYQIAYGNRIVVDTMINGQGPFHLLVDTGSSTSIVFQHVANTLALLPVAQESITVHPIAETSVSLPYELRAINLGGETISRLQIAVIQDWDAPGAGPDGILGIDVLERYALVFDHEHGQMLLFPRARGVPAPYNDWNSTPLEPRRLKDVPVDFWFFDARYSNTRAGTLLDLGTGVTILTWELAQDIVDRRSMPRKTDDKVRDALGKDLPAFRLEGLDIEVARHAWYGQTALVADAPVFDFLGVKGLPAGIAGPGLMRNASFAIDFENHKLYMGPHT